MTVATESSLLWGSGVGRRARAPTGGVQRCNNRPRVGSKQKKAKTGNGQNTNEEGHQNILESNEGKRYVNMLAGMKSEFLLI